MVSFDALSEERQQIGLRPVRIVRAIVVFRALSVWFLFLAIVGLSLPATAQLSGPGVVKELDGQQDRYEHAIIFIHGLMGSASETWTAPNSPKNLAQLLMDAAPRGIDAIPLRNFKMYFIDYSQAFRGISDVESISRTVAAQLLASKALREHRTVYIIGHSLGGLIAKRSILFLLQRTTDAVHKISGLAFLGVPSKGAPLADWATSYGVVDLARYLGWNTEIVQSLTTRSEVINSLTENWQRTRAHFRQSGHGGFFPHISCVREGQMEQIGGTAEGGNVFAKGWNFLLRQFSTQLTVVPKEYTYSGEECDDDGGDIIAASHTQLPKAQS
jgi:pimeloyl-ACP methyl ester carboxylesterase